LVTRTIHFGIGAMGAATVAHALERADIQVVGAFDADPAKVGRDLGDVIGLGRVTGVRVADSGGADWPDADVVVHGTSSSLEQVAPQLEAALARGLDVVSICEELSFPWVRRPELAARLDGLARQHGVTLLGTGVNPGFAMDTWPIALTAISRSVESIRVTRVLDASGRRLPLQQKVGAGLTVEQFHEKAATGTFGHIGLLESAMAVAHALRWEPYELEHRLEPVVAQEATASQYFQVAPGQAAGIHETLTLRHGGREVLRLDLTMALGATDPRDEVVVEGDPPLNVVARGGFHGDRSTTGIAINSALLVNALPPGLLTMRDVPPVHWMSARAGVRED